MHEQHTYFCRFRLTGKWQSRLLDSLDVVAGDGDRQVRVTCVNTRWRWGGDEGLRLVWRAELGVTEAGAAGSCLHPMHAAPTQPRTLPGHVKV